MSRRPKMKKMAKGGTVGAPTKGPIYDGLLKPAKDSHDGTVKMIGDLRSAKNRMPKRFKNLFPDF